MITKAVVTHTTAGLVTRTKSNELFLKYLVNRISKFGLRFINVF